MFPKKTIDLIILSILSENPNGLTGYSLVMKMKQIFPMKNISPGTIYPKLKKLNETGDIQEENKIYTITLQGKERLQKSTPGIIDDTLKFLPKLYQHLVKTLPFNIKMDYISDIPSCFSFGLDSEHENEIFSEDFICSSSVSDSLNYLKSLRSKLEQTRIQIKDRFEKRLHAINQQVKKIDERIQKCHEEKKTWKRIPIEDDE